MEDLFNSSAYRFQKGACCFASFGDALFPNRDIGYKRLDVRAAKF
jgi:hypothetical protein